MMSHPQKCQQLMHRCSPKWLQNKSTVACESAFAKQYLDCCDSLLYTNSTVPGLVSKWLPSYTDCSLVLTFALLTKYMSADGRSKTPRQLLYKHLLHSCMA